MGYKEVGGARSYPKYKECKVGQVLVEGKFIREIEGKYGKQFEFENDDGSIVVLNGSGQLKYKMDFVRPNEKVKITYEGSVILDSGAMKGKPAHQFIVLKDEDYTEETEETEASVDSGTGEIDDFADL